MLNLNHSFANHVLVSYPEILLPSSAVLAAALLCFCNLFVNCFCLYLEY